MTNTEMRQKLVTRIAQLRDAKHANEDAEIDAIVQMAAAVSLVRCIDLVATTPGVSVRAVLDKAHTNNMAAAKDFPDVLSGHTEIYQASVKLLSELA